MTPSVIIKDDYKELYYKEDKSYFLAKTNFFLSFIFAGKVTDPKFATYMRMIVYAINHSLRNFLFIESLNRNSFKIKGLPKYFSSKFT